jgi:NADP-dependent 3-hydroxy acid dehydrogenase YdfG
MYISYSILKGKKILFNIYIMTITITWASTWIWKQIAKNINPGTDIELIWWRNEKKLNSVANSVNSTKTVTWDIFNPKTEAYQEIIESKSKVQILNAAINVDTVDKDKQDELVRIQNEFLQSKIDEMIETGVDEETLLIVITSIASSFVDILWEKAMRRSPYALMKNTQSKIIKNSKDKLNELWISIIEVQPGFTKTDMVSHLDDDKWLKLANMFWKKASSEEIKLIQDNVLTPEEVWKTIATIANQFISSSNIDWISEKYPILNDKDLK